MKFTIEVEAPELLSVLERIATALETTSVRNVTVINPLDEGTQKAETRKKPDKKETVKAEEKDELPESIEAVEEDSKPDITLVMVRAHMQKLSDAGRQADAKGILASRGYKKLSDVPEDEYGEIIEVIEGLLA